MDNPTNPSRPSRPDPITPEALPPAVWRAVVPIRFSHCDAAGIVYTPNYFDLFNGVIEDFYPAVLGIDYHALLLHRRIGLGYASAGCDFFAPSRMGDRLDVAVMPERIGGASLALVLHAFVDGRERVRGRFISVTTIIGTGKVIPLPDDLRAGLERYQERLAVIPDGAADPGS